MAQTCTNTGERSVATGKNRSFLKGLSRALDVWRQRRRLERLDDAALRDLGLDRHQVEREARRPIWDVPHTWRR